MPKNLGKECETELRAASALVDGLLERCVAAQDGNFEWRELEHGLGLLESRVRCARYRADKMALFDARRRRVHLVE